MPNPVGILWYHWTGVRSVEILNCYVPQTYRRCGVMSFLLKKLLATNRNIRKVTTADATKESGPWLTRMGFRQAEDDDWTLKIKPKT
jgi:N-acetylglutamate synthase-like GNAT family acetyltransferase